MRDYTDIEDFKSGVAKLAAQNSGYKMMPVVLEVNNSLAPFGICTKRTINGVECLVFSGTSRSLKNISEENRKEQIETCKG